MLPIEPPLLPGNKALFPVNMWPKLVNLSNEAILIQIQYFFLKVGPPKENIFLPHSMVYISVTNTQTLQITFLHVFLFFC